VLGVKAIPKVVRAEAVAGHAAAAGNEKIQHHYKWRWTLMLPYGLAEARIKPRQRPWLL